MAGHRTVFERQPPPASAVDHALAGVRDACFWLEDAPGRRFPALSGEVSADLAVVGGGYCGLWTAVEAKRRDPDRRVVLVEGHTMGWAASGRNGGFCSASITHGEENGRTRWPEEYPTLERLGRENLAGIAATVAEFSMDCEFEQTGEMSVAVEPYQVEQLQEAAADGGPRVLTAQEIRARVNSPTYLAATFDPDCAMVHPAKLVQELARVAHDLGVEVFEHTPALGLERSGEGVRVRTPRGAVSARRVALATNVFPALLRRHRPLTVPVWDFALMTEPLTPAQLAEIGWSERCGVGDRANQFHYYRLTADRRILWGGYDALHHLGGRLDRRHEHHPATHRLLTEHLLTTFPALEGIRVTHRWGGAIDTSTRFAAFVATAWQGRVAHAAGFTGLGVGTARFAAEVMLDRLAGESTERTDLEMVRRLPVPFPPEPLTAVGVALTRRALDRADHHRGQRNLWLRSLDALGLGFDS